MNSRKQVEGGEENTMEELEKIYMQKKSEQKALIKLLKALEKNANKQNLQDKNN
jgi:hypothetical protein